MSGEETGGGEALQHTALTSRHEALGARMVPFAGWYMPVQYSGILNEHRTVRSAAGLFDLGHMGQVRVTGPDALALHKLFDPRRHLTEIDEIFRRLGLLPSSTDK